MQTTPGKLISREVPANIKPTLDLFADTLEEFVNFGTLLIDWDTNPKTKGEENIAPTMLLRHLMDLVDSISILVRSSCGDTSKLLIRGVFETMLSLEYLFEKDTHNRSIAFLVVDIINQIKTLKKYDSTTNEGKQLYSLFDRENTIKDFRLDEKYNIRGEIKKKKDILTLPQFKDVYAEYQRMSKKDNKVDIKWYRFYEGPRNIFDLSKHLNKGSFYELFYRKWSGATHASDVYLGKLNGNESNTIDIIQLRYVKDVQEITKYSMIFSLMSMDFFIKNRIPQRSVDLKQWYSSIREQYHFIMKKNLIEVV